MNAHSRPIVPDFRARLDTQKRPLAALGAERRGQVAPRIRHGRHVATGRDWHGNPVTQGFVAYVQLEGHGGLDNRIAALAGTFGDLPLWFPARAVLAG